MTEIGGLTIVNPDDGLVSGGAFYLDETPSEHQFIEIDGWEIEMEPENPYIVARGPDTIPEGNIVGETHEKTQQGLDILSVQNDGDYTCENVDSNRITAWTDNNTQHLRLTCITDLPLDSDVEVTVIDDDGNERERTTPDTEWHESLRYFRLSQNTDDLFDAYRNMFLALEHVLSDRIPPNPGEGESDWIKRALQDAHASIDLSSYAPNNSAPVESFHGYQYENTRCRMFHAKRGKSRLLPHEVADRQHVLDALSDLSRAYVDIVKDTVHVNRHSGVFTHAGFESLTKWMDDESGTEVAVSDNNALVQKSEQLASGPWKGAARYTASFSEKLSTPGQRSVLSEVEPSGANLPDRIFRAGLVNVQDGGEEDVLMTSAPIESGLTVGGVDAFQCELGMRLQNVGSARLRFPS